RCMDCGTPGCHALCPVHNLIPDWNLLVSEADWRAAYEQLASTNNFPEFTGRICSAPCEHACTLTINSRPVTIRSIELAIVEHAWRAGWIRPQRARRRLFRRVAIIGSGPAGLACAQQLARSGYQVTVYEKADRPGGLLRYGIPDFRLEKSVLDRRLAQLAAEGVRFRTGIHVGRDLAVRDLQRSTHAVVLAVGAEQPRDLDVPGRSLRGVHFALDYLCQQNRRIAGCVIDSGTAIRAAGRSVVVIGGGDTGSDCVGTAIRQGARAVVQIQYHDCPPPTPDRLLYWPQPVPGRQVSDHDAEGCSHLWSYDTIAFEGRGGRVRRLLLQPLRWEPAADGVLRKRPGTGMLRQLTADLVLLAMGYAHPRHAGLLQSLALDLDARGNIAASDRCFQTSTEGVFACGDGRRGQSLVVWAIREGRQCARAVDTWLSGESTLPAV
ncbi:MAG TPA: glutamate synthase subunit beta, partial [Gammaproteobacteria bacterium]|nr:glutamate synthase subunit beta [Gammaproteobacteria bacterium]